MVVSGVMWCRMMLCDIMWCYVMLDVCDVMSCDIIIIIYDFDTGLGMLIETFGGHTHTCCITAA